MRGQEGSADAALTRLPYGAWGTAGATSCQGNDVVSCAQRDDDQCLEWSDPTACPVDTPYCSFGVCAKTCVDECAPGVKRCAGPPAVVVCAQTDSASGGDWLSAVACAPRETC